MLRRRFLGVAALAVFATGGACSHRAAAPPAAAALTPGATSILFIGNSYTYFNELPQLLTQLAAGKRVLQTERETAGGQTLEWHYGNGGGPGPAAIRKRKWDFVVLQDHSLRPLNDPDKFAQAAVLLDHVVDEGGAQTVFYETWARKATPALQPRYDEGYGQVAQVTHAYLAPVGAAWARVRAERSDIELFNVDGSHPTYAGSYLGACVFYAVILDQSPVGAPPLDLPAEVAAYLQRTAWQTVSTSVVRFK